MEKKWDNIQVSRVIREDGWNECSNEMRWVEYNKYRQK